jgi:pentapeptide repeat protein
MRWRKCGLFQVGIILTSMAFSLLLATWTPVSLAHAQEVTSAAATPSTITVQAMLTEDATVIALNKEKLAQEIKQLQAQNEPDLFEWLVTNASMLLSTLLVVGGGIFGLLRYLAERRDSQRRLLEDRQAERDRQEEEQKRWLKDQEVERERRAEERFQAAAIGLGDEKEGTKIGAAILLRTFLHPGYEGFYAQTFDLAVAHLRLPRASTPSENQDTPMPLTTLSQALIVIFKEAFPLARSLEIGKSQPPDAASIQLDNAHLREADLKQVRMPLASLRKVDLKKATLSRANLFNAKLCEASLTGADLSEANLIMANLSKAWLRRANLSRANLSEANLAGANFNEANLSGAILNKVNIEDAQSLKDTNLQGVIGLTREQLAVCKAKGAILAENPTTDAS